MAFTSVEGLLRSAEQVPLWQAVRMDDQRDRGVSAEDSWHQMSRLWLPPRREQAECSPPC